MLSAEQKQIRKSRVGASEIGCLVDFYSPRPDGERVDPHKTAFDVFADRDCPVTEEEADHRQWGLDLEGAILSNYVRRKNLVLAPSPGTLVHPTIGALCATPDALAVTEDHRYRDLQAKNAQHHQAWRWGEAGSDNVPLLYVAQVTIELGILREKYTHVDETGEVVVSLGGAPPVGFPIRFDPELFGQLATLAEKFKRDHLDARKPPPITPQTADSAAEWIRRKYPRHAGKMIEPNDQDRVLVQLVATLRNSGKALDDEKKTAEAQLKARIADAEGIEGLCTFRAAKDTTGPVTDWGLVLEEICAKTSLDRAMVRALVADHTKQIVTRRGSRRLLLTGEN